jgi:hypothetical protein
MNNQTDIPIVDIKFVRIPRDEYEKLKDDSLLLRCLENGGVDNWEWYGEAIRSYNKLKGISDD